MAQGTDIAAAAVAEATDGDPDAGGALPLEALDRSLAPLRRTVAYALRAERAVRFLEVNGGRWLENALRLDLPHPIRDLLATISGRLKGYDEAHAEERLERLRVVNQTLIRVDAVLGLPLHQSIEAPERADSSSPDDKRASKKARRKSKKKKKPASPEKSSGRDTSGESSASPEAPSAPDSDDDALDLDSPDRPHRLGDPRVTGQSLADLGTDPDLVAALAAHGITTYADLLWQAPVGEEVLRPIHGAGRAVPDGPAAVGGRVRSRATVLGPDGARRTVLRVVGAGPLRVVLRDVAPAWLLQRLQPGTRVVLAGIYRSGEGDEGLFDAEWVPDPPSNVVHRVRYGLEGVDDVRLRREHVRLTPLLEHLRDTLPTSERERLDLPPQDDALRQAHAAGGAHPEARRRLAYDEAVTALLGLSRRDDDRQRGIAHPIVHGLWSKVTRFNELELTDPQQEALEQIKRDLRRNTPMLRLLTGEVGVGPGNLPLAATVLVAETKSQVLSVSPDRATAEARYLFAEPLLHDVGLVARLLDEKPSRAQRDAVRRGEVHVVFGSTPLLDASLEFRRLGLVVAEEGPGLRQTADRVAALRAPRPDALVYTTAPVPTGALLRAYPDHAVSAVASVVAEPGSCEVLEAGDRLAAYERVAKRVSAGEQAWVFFPMVRGHDVLDTREVTRVKATLEQQVFPDARVAVFHGSMSREDRYRVYQDFRHRRYDVLIATTIVEDGPPVPDATVAVVEHADKLSWRRAVRLRGHIARGRREPGAFFILGNDPRPDDVDALRLVASRDPFDAAIADALGQLEWPAGAPEAPRCAWLDLARDRDLVIAAHRLAHDLLGHDPGLRAQPALGLGRAARTLWPRLFDDECPIPEVKSSGRRRRRRRKRK